MKTIDYRIAIGAIILALLAGGYWLHTAFASVETGGEYNSQMVTSGSSTAQTIVKSSWGTLGSIVMTGVSTTTGDVPLITVYDTASSTAASTTLTKVAEIDGANTTLGTYTFDVVVNSGLGLWVHPSFDGTVTVTWR